jgi:hypothetical protein
MGIPTEGLIRCRASARAVMERLRTVHDKVGALGDSASLRLGNDREKALRSVHACKPKMLEMRVLSESSG